VRWRDRMDRHCRCACVRPGQRRQPSISLSRKSSAHRGSSPARTQHRRSSGAGAARLCAVAASVTRCAMLPHVAWCTLHQGVVHVVHRVVGCMLQRGMRHVATLHVACCGGGGAASSHGRGCSRRAASSACLSPRRSCIPRAGGASSAVRCPLPRGAASRMRASEKCVGRSDARSIYRYR